MMRPAVAVDEEHVYWTQRGSAAARETDGAVKRVRRTGGHVEIIAAGQHAPVSVLVTAHEVVWANAGAQGVARDGSIVRAPK